MGVDMPTSPWSSRGSSSLQLLLHVFQDGLGNVDSCIGNRHFILGVLVGLWFQTTYGVLVAQHHETVHCASVEAFEFTGT